MTALRFQQLTVTTGREQPWELDGEIMGGTRRLMIVTQPGRLLVRVPARPPAAASTGRPLFRAFPLPGQARLRWLT